MGWNWWMFVSLIIRQWSITLWLCCNVHTSLYFKGFCTINHLGNPSPLQSFGYSHLLCEPFLSFFTEKFDNIRKLIKPCNSGLSPTPSCVASLNKFDEVSIWNKFDEGSIWNPLSHICPASSASKADFWALYFKYVVLIINSSLWTGTVPLDFKQVVVQPLLKKPNLDYNFF